MMISKPTRFLAIAEGVLATIIWSSSFVFVKIGLDYLGPLTVAGLRYFLAFLVLAPLLPRNRRAARAWSSGLWVRLFLIGLSAYAIGNGALFWGLKYLPATTASFLMSISPLLILFAGTIWLKEIPRERNNADKFNEIPQTVISVGPGLAADCAVGLEGVRLGGQQPMKFEQKIQNPIIRVICVLEHLWAS